MKVRAASALLLAACSPPPGPGTRVAVFPCCATQLAADSASIYVGYAVYSGGPTPSGDVYRVDLTADAGAPSLFAHFPVEQVALAAAGGRVFVSDGLQDGGLYVATGPGDVRLLIAAPLVGEIAADTDRVYWVENPPGQSAPKVRSAAIDGGPVSEVGRGDQIALGGDALYWTHGPSLLRAPKTDLSAAIEVAKSTAPPDYVPFGALGAGDAVIAWSDLDRDILESRAGGAPVRVGSLPLLAMFLGVLPDRVFAKTFEFAWQPEEDALTLPPIRHRMYRQQGATFSEIAEGQTPTQLDGAAVVAGGAVYWMLEGVLYRVE